MFNKQAFEKITDEIVNKLREYIEKDPGLRIIRREYGVGYYKVFKDSLYEYNDGIILLERLYKEKMVKYDMFEQAYMDDSDKELIQRLEEISKEVPDADAVSGEEGEKHLQEVQDLCKDISNIKVKYRDASFEYIDSVLCKIAVKSISSLTDEEISARAVLSSSLALTMYQSLFLADEFEQGLSILGIDQGEYIDMVLVPYSSEGDIQEVNSQDMSNQEMDNQETDNQETDSQEVSIQEENKKEEE